MKTTNKIMKENNESWYIYIAGVVIITLLLMLNAVSANKLSFDMTPSEDAGKYTEHKPYLSLPRGSYQLEFSGGEVCTVTNPDGMEFGSGRNKIDIKLDKDESNLIISTQSGSISKVTVSSKHSIFNDTILISLLIGAFLIYIGYIRFKKKTDLNSSAVGVILIAAAVFATYPVFSDYITYGQDLNFHLYRIEGLKDGLLSGQFPVRVDPTHNNGYGYITASVYPSLFMYFPALLRLCGISLVNSYKIFLFAVNLATAFIMYSCTKKMTKSGFAALFAAIVYTLSTWRIVNLIYRAAIGEALAMTFFPVVILGLYYMLKDDKSKWWVFALGCSAVFHSHIISCIFVTMLTAVTILVFLEDFMSEKRWLGLIKAAVFTLLVNLWYLIPFVTYYFGCDLAIKHTPYNVEYFSNAIFPAEMFNFFNDKFGISQLIPKGIRGNMSLSLGAGVTFCFAAAAMYFIFDRKNKMKHYDFYAEMFLFAVFIMFMASTLFPSELLQKPKLANAIAGTIRMPWRFLSLASPIICIVCAAAAAVRINSNAAKKTVIGAACIVCSFSFVFFGSAYTTSFDAHMKLGQAAPTDHSSGWDNEYFMYGTKVGELESEKYSVSDSSSVKIVSFQKRGTNITLEVSGAKDGEYIEVPLLYYPGYSAEADGAGKLETQLGNNNVLRVNLSDGAEKIQIKYSGLLSFKIACIISLFTALSAVFCIYRRKKKQGESLS